MGRRATLALGLAVVGTLGACVETASCVGYGSTAEATETPPSSDGDGLTSIT